jgi:hypothetical protein
MLGSYTNFGVTSCVISVLFMEQVVPELAHLAVKPEQALFSKQLASQTELF